MKKGVQVSCGCHHKEVVARHGMEGAPTYHVWASMKSRCQNQRHRAYADYGARGITVCDRWQKFENFLSDMGEKPEKMTLDRIDNDRGYFPENCRWRSYKEQNRNRRSNSHLTFGGKTMTAVEWCERIGMAQSTLKNRMSRGWSIEKALTYPIDSRKGSRNRKEM